jgi:cytochrome c oxidase assembly factor CtaG
VTARVEGGPRPEVIPDSQPSVLTVRSRRWAFPVALALLVVGLTPPLSTAASRYALFEALQFSVFAVIVPGLLCFAAPWRLIGLGRPLVRMQARRLRHDRLRDAALVVVPALALEALWRSTVLVDHLAQHRWLAFVEAAMLVPAGTAIWAELVRSPPLSPRLPAHARIAVSAVSMWTIWIAAYVVGLTNSDAYRVYASVAHRSLSVAADQQLTAGLLWAVAAIAFMPIAFANLMTWLRRN